MWANLDRDILIRSFVPTGVTNSGLIEQENLHSKLSAIMDEGGDDSETEDNCDELDANGLSDREESGDEEDDDLDEEDYFDIQL